MTAKPQIRASRCRQQLTSGCAEDGAAVCAGDHSLAVAEDCGNVEAALALDVHEVAVRRLDQALQLVLLLLHLLGRVQQINVCCQHHVAGVRAVVGFWLVGVVPGAAFLFLFPVAEWLPGLGFESGSKAGGFKGV